MDHFDVFGQNRIYKIKKIMGDPHWLIKLTQNYIITSEVNEIFNKKLLRTKRSVKMSK